jgi:hypothetical protein
MAIIALAMLSCDALGADPPTVVQSDINPVELLVKKNTMQYQDQNVNLTPKVEFNIVSTSITPHEALAEVFVVTSRFDDQTLVTPAFVGDESGVTVGLVRTVTNMKQIASVDKTVSTGGAEKEVRCGTTLVVARSCG